MNTAFFKLSVILVGFFIVLGVTGNAGVAFSSFHDFDAGGGTAGGTGSGGTGGTGGVPGSGGTGSDPGSGMEGAGKGKLIIIKQAKGGSGDFTFKNKDNAEIAKLSPNSANFFEDRSSFYVDPIDGYAITETLPSGWKLTTAECVLQNNTAKGQKRGTFNSGANSITGINISATEEIACTFNNELGQQSGDGSGGGSFDGGGDGAGGGGDFSGGGGTDGSTSTQNGTIKIVKKTTGGNEKFNYSLLGNNTSKNTSITTQGSPDGSGESSFVQLPAGKTYRITELFPANSPFWKPVDASCVLEDGSSTGKPFDTNCSTGTCVNIPDIEVIAGQTTTCNYTNAYNDGSNDENSGSDPGPAPNPVCIEAKDLGSDYVVLKDYKYLGIDVQDWQNNSQGGQMERWHKGENNWFWHIDQKTNNMVEGYFNSVSGTWAINANPQNWLHYEGRNTWKKITLDCSASSEKGTLKIVKKTTGGDGKFDYAVSGPEKLSISLSTSSGTATSDTKTVKTGTTYAIAETLPSGWTVDSASCQLSNGEKTGSFNSADKSVVDVTIQKDSLTTCTFNNTLANSNDDNPPSGNDADGSQCQNVSIPIISSISPTSTNEGGAAFVLYVSGEKFASNSYITFGNLSKTTTHISEGIVTALITAKDIAQSGAYDVTVTNPSPDPQTCQDQTSDRKRFIVNSTTSTLGKPGVNVEFALPPENTQ